MKFNDNLKENVLFFQAISTRDKKTGKYLPTMDGNLNITLSRISIRQKELNSAIITLPPIHDIDDEQYATLLNSVKDFSCKVYMHHMTNCYGLNIDETRINTIVKNSKGIQTHIHAIALEYDINTVISDFPLVINHDNVIYNYNWSYCSHDETSKTLKDYYELEKGLAKTNKTYLYSDIQYDFWQSDNEDFDTMKVHRSTEIFDPRWLKQVSDGAIQEYLSDVSMHELHAIDDALRSLCIFYASRIEDPRYRFDDVLANCSKWETLILMNPTNIDITETLRKCHKRGIHYINATNVRNKRGLYFYILSRLSEDDKIIRYEHDMHISLIEQSILTQARIIVPNITPDNINSYIYHNELH